MIDPISVTGLSLQVVQILTPIIIALAKAYTDGKKFDQNLTELQRDLESVQAWTKDISNLFLVRRFADAIQDVERDSNFELQTGIQRVLQNCATDAEKLSEVLKRFGLKLPGGKVSRTYYQWRLDARHDDIDRLKQNFRDYKSSIQLNLLVLNTCKQMELGERDERNATDLKLQLDKLHVAIDQISTKISELQSLPLDEGQTERLEDMEYILHTSSRLERRATVRLEEITALVGETRDATSPVDTLSISEVRSPGRRSLPRRPEIEASTLPISEEEISAPLTPHSANEVSTRSPSYFRATISPSDENGKNPLLMTAQEFENTMVQYFDDALAKGMGKEKSYSDEFIARVADLLVRVGEREWSGRPRTYIVLRSINHVKFMDKFVLDDLRDIDFPYTSSGLPSCIETAGVQDEFLYMQRYVLSKRAADLVKGGRHHHLEKNADKYFRSLGTLGSGGFGSVDKVRDNLSLRVYARKTFDRSKTFAKNRKVLESFERELHNLKRLTHLHIVKFVGSYTDKKHVAFIMHPVADMDLHQYLQHTEWTEENLSTLRSFIGCLATALAYLHAKNCRHKDLKPRNILIEGERVLISDFGTALHFDESNNEITFGAPEAFTKLYVAPEVVMHQPRGCPSDIWSLGCIFLEIATILAVQSLHTKSDFFESCGTASAAYWLNQKEIGVWISKLQEQSGAIDVSLHDWIELMTANDPSIRPTAEHLVCQIRDGKTSNRAYARVCCFGDSASDSSSWCGSVGDDDFFEPAHPGSELTTISASGTKPDGSLSTQPAPTSGRPIQLGKAHSSPLVDTESQAISERLARSQSLDQFDREASSSLSGSRPIMDSSLEGSHVSKHPPPNPDETQVPQASSPSLQVNSENELQLVATAAEESNPGPQTNAEILFYQSQTRFESYLIDLRHQDPNWRTQLSNLIETGARDNKGCNILVMASKFYNTALAMEIVETALHQNPGLVNVSAGNDSSALHYATLRGSSDMTELLLESGANPHNRNMVGRTPLHISLSSKCFDATKMLLKGISSLQINLVDNIGRTALHVACFSKAPVEVIQLLLDAGASVDIKDHYGDLPIAIASTQSAQILLPIMLQQCPGLKVEPPKSTWTSNEGKAISECICGICIAVMALRRRGNLLFKDDTCCFCQVHIRVIEVETMWKRTSLDSTLESCSCNTCTETRYQHNLSHEPCVPPLDSGYLSYSTTLRPERVVGEYPGHQYYDNLIKESLSKNDHELPEEEIRSMALKSLADAGFRGKLSYRIHPDKALQYVIDHCRSFHHLASVVEILLHQGAQVDQYSSDGCETILTISAELGNLELMNILLEKNARLETPTGPTYVPVVIGHTYRMKPRQLTPLRRAIWIGNPQSARMLLRAGANVNENDMLSSKQADVVFRNDIERVAALKDIPTSILHEAATRCGNLIPLLLAHGAKTEIRDHAGNTPLHSAIIGEKPHAVVALLEGGADVEAVGSQSMSSLGMAIKRGNRRIILTLLTHGANIHQKCGPSFCALSCAIRYGLGDIVRILIEEYSAREDLSRMSASGRSVVHILASSTIQDVAVINLVLENKHLEKAKFLNMEDDNGCTPLHIAAKNGNATVVRRLLDHKAIAYAQDSSGKTPMDYAQEQRNAEVVKELGGKLVEIKEKKSKWWRRSKIGS